MASKSRKRRSLRGLAVKGVITGSPELYERQTIGCPPNSGKSACQKVYGRFQMDVQDEAKPELLRTEVTSAVQTNMNRTEGGLQEYLDQVQPDSPIAVVGVPEDGVLRPPTPAPSPSPTQAPDGSRSSGGGGGSDGGGEGGGMGIGLLIGIIVGGLVLCCCCIYCVYAGEDGPLGNLFDRKPKKKRRTETEGSVNQFGDDLPPPGGNDNTSGLGALGVFGSGNGPTGDDDDTTQGGFSIQEQAQAQSKNRFGFGKKSTENALGPVNGMDGDQDESLADYGFDDATIDQSKAGDDNPSLAGGDWNPQKPPTAGTTDPWSDRRRASPSTESEESDDDGTGYGDSDSESDTGSGSEGEEDVYREDTKGRYDDDDGEGDSYGDDYDDDYDDNYDDNTNFGDEQTMESETFRGEDNNASINFNASAGGLATQEFDDMVDQGNWSGIMRNADGEMDVDATFGNAQTNNASFDDSGEGLEFGGPDSPSRRSERSHSQSNGSRGSGPPKSPARSRSSNESQKQDYLERVRELVRQVVPDEVDNVPAMMEQFAGREEELINTLQTMYERSTSTRARKAVHRSKGIPDESGRFTAGTADGTAAVAAASTIGQGFDSFTDGSQSQSRTGSYMDNGSYADGGSYAGQSYEQGSYRDGSYGEGSYRDNSYGEGSYRDNSYGEGSYTEGEGSFRDDYHDDEYGGGGDDYDDNYGEEGSYSRGSYDDGGSYRSGSRGSQGSYSRGSQGSYSRGSQGSYSRGSQGSHSRGSQGSYSRGERSYGDDGHYDDGGGDYDDDYDDDYDQQHEDFDASFGGHRDFDDDDEGSFADEYD